MRGATGAIVVALCVLAAVLGFGLGREEVRIPSETVAIERAAARYLNDAGPDARPENCEARPMYSPEVWIEVMCVHKDGARLVYQIEPNGAVTQLQSPET